MIVLLLGTESGEEKVDYDFIPGQLVMHKGFLTAYAATARKAGLTLAQAAERRHGKQFAECFRDRDECFHNGDANQPSPDQPAQREPAQLPSVGSLGCRDEEMSKRDVDTNKEFRDAAMKGDVDKLCSLAQLGCAVDARDPRNGNTAAHCAITMGQVHVLHVLRELGCPMDARNHTGHTAVHYVILENFDMGKEWSERLLDALRALAELGCPIDTQDENGWTALHLAAYGNQIDMLRALVELRCPMDAQDVNGRTAAHVAVTRGQVDALRALGQLGCSLTAKDRNGKTAADLAYSSCYHNRNLLRWEAIPCRFM